MQRPFAYAPRVLRFGTLTLVLAVLFFLSLASPTRAQATHDVKVGGEITDISATTGVIWFNGYDPGTLIISPGDTVVWEAIGGVHTVTSSVRLPNGSFEYDSSPLFTPEGALADIAPGLLLGPGAVYEVNTSALAPGTYVVFCKIHPGMQGSLVVTSGPVTTPVVTAVAGFGDSVFAQQAFVPANLTVPRGTIVRWTLMNPTEPHTITGFDSAAPTVLVWDSSPNLPQGPPPVMLPGQIFRHTYTSEGTFIYFCKVHAYLVGESWVGMVGTIQVVDTSGADTTALNAAVSTATILGYVAIGIAVLALVVAIVAMVRRKGGGP